VIARVTRLQTRQATLAILVVGEAVCADAIMAVVRREDVRGWEIDKVIMGESVRVGDLVRGVVVSDFSSYP
jgi:exosome complex component CSL4